MSWGHPSIRGFGSAVTVVTYIADQASKLWLLFVADIAAKGPFPVTSFFDLTLVWNRGISYGMFQQHSELGRWFLVIGSVAASAWLYAILWRAPDRLTAASLGLLIGGALGNAADRLMYGAVFDFAHFHIGDWSWYVFNVADVAIVVGVAGLLYDSLIAGRWKKLGRSG